jgi:hypothetical protein
VEYDEPLVATASLVRSWLLLEQPGPWGSDALRQSELPPEVAGILHDRSSEHDVRVLLLRRTAPGADSRSCFVGYSAPPDPWMEERVLADEGQVLGLDLAALAVGRRPGFGAPRREPLYAVCTNSRHDPCCGRLGRPIARALVDVVGDAVWECSHLGGERFAGNLVCFPHGLYFGRLEPDSAAQVVASYERGMIELDHYRGRAGDPFVVQAAEFFARRHHALRGVDDLRYQGHRGAGSGMVDVTFARSDGSPLEVRVGRRRDPRGRALTCHSSTPSQPPTYSLLSLPEP